MQTVEPKTLEVTLQDQAVELEVLQEFPSYLICEDGVLVEPDGTLIEEFDMGEVLDRDIDTDLVPKRPRRQRRRASSPSRLPSARRPRLASITP
jgi:hypothetical protein